MRIKYRDVGVIHIYTAFYRFLDVSWQAGNLQGTSKGVFPVMQDQHGLRTLRATQNLLGMPIVYWGKVEPA